MSLVFTIKVGRKIFVPLIPKLFKSLNQFEFDLSPSRPKLRSTQTEASKTEVLPSPTKGETRFHPLPRGSGLPKSVLIGVTTEHDHYDH